MLYSPDGFVIRGATLPDGEMQTDVLISCKVQHPELFVFRVSLFFSFLTYILEFDLS